MIMKMMDGCTCSGKDVGTALGGAAVGGLALTCIVGGYFAQSSSSVIIGWLWYSIGLVLILVAKMLMHKGFNNGCKVHSMHGMMAMMEDAPKGKNGKRKR